MNNQIIEALERRENVFLTGGAGVGKSYTTAAVCEHYLHKGKLVVKLASTGIAAAHLGGQTLHSFFKIGIANSLQALQENGDYVAKASLKRIIKAADLIVIDEISMVSSGVMEIIRLRLMQGEFSGVLMVVGDFLQLPPILKPKIMEAYARVHPFEDISKVFGFAFESDAWGLFEFKAVQLTVMKRTKDREFIEVLHALRKGVLNLEHRAFLENCFNEGEHLSRPTYLFAKNADASLHNKKELDYLKGKAFLLEAKVEIERKSVKEQEIERFVKDIRVERYMQLKVGAQVLFLRNSWNYYNGERGEVVEIDKEKETIWVEKESGQMVKVEPEIFNKIELKEREIDGKKVFEEVTRFSLQQYPLALAYAITIHKSQGMSLHETVVHIDDIFAPSQFYVAISRATNPKRLILRGSPNKISKLVFANSKAREFYISADIN